MVTSVMMILLARKPKIGDPRGASFPKVPENRYGKSMDANRTGKGVIPAGNMTA